MAAISALMASALASASFWEFVEYCAMGAVFLGVFGEAIADRMRAYWRWKHTTKKWSEGLLITALAVELLATVRTNSINNLAIADLGVKAQQATELAGKLGAKVDELPSFVAQKIKEVNNQIDAFKGSASEQKKQTDAVIADLDIDRQKLDKARMESVAAAKEAKEALAAVNAARKPRNLTPEQQTELGKKMALLAIKRRQDVAVFPTSSLFEVSNLADQIAVALGAEHAGWVVNRNPVNMAQGTFAILGVGIRTYASERGQFVAASLANVLNEEGINAFVIDQNWRGCTEKSNDPVVEEACSFVSVMVGDHP